MQLLLTGQAKFGMVGPDAILLAAAEKPVPLQSVYTIVREMIFAAAVRDDSPAPYSLRSPGAAVHNCPYVYPRPLLPRI